MVTRLAALALALAGCSLLVPLDDLTGHSKGDSGSGTDAPAGTDGAGDSSPCTNTNDDQFNCGQCGHSCFGGLCSASKCEPFVVARDEGVPLGIFVPPPASKYARDIFWINRRPRPSLRRGPKDGGGAPQSLEDAVDVLSDPFDLVADEEAVYWSEVDASVVYRKAIGSGAMRKEWRPVGGIAGFVVIDAGEVYASSYQPQSQLGFIVSKENLYSGDYKVGGLAAQADVIYWIQLQQNVNQIARGLKIGGAPVTTITDTGPSPMGLAVDDAFLYWTEEGRLIRRRPKGVVGATTTIYTAPQPFGESDIAVDADSIYWTESMTGFVRRLAKPPR